MKIDNFFNVLKKNDNITYTIYQKLKYFSLSYVIAFTAVIFSAILIIFVDKFIVNNLGFESVKGLIHQNSQTIHIMSFFLVIIMIPLIEETLFRLLLTINKLNFSLFLLPFTFKLSGGYITGFEINQQIKYIFIAVCISLLAYLKPPDYLFSFLKKNINVLIYMSILLFGLMHITNIRILHWELSLLYPIFVIPQIIIGYFITNLRLKFGFFWGVLFHSLINLVPYLIGNTV